MAYKCLSAPSDKARRRSVFKETNMTQLTRNDLWSLEEYATRRADFRAEVMAHKKNRQLALGEHARLYFEDATTIRYQIQEMLRIERVFEPEGHRGRAERLQPAHTGRAELESDFYDRNPRPCTARYSSWRDDWY
jgi:hypothetical protein